MKLRVKPLQRKDAGRGLASIDRDAMADIGIRSPAGFRCPPSTRHPTVGAVHHRPSIQQSSQTEIRAIIELSFERAPMSTHVMGTSRRQ